jgi:membrane protease YdiL (CAAX protease family)
MAVSALPPYLAYSAGIGEFHWAGMASLLAIALVVSFWYVLLPRQRAADLGLLAFASALLLSKLFKKIYVPPVPDLELQILGQLLLIRLAATSILLVRGVHDTGYGFLPTRRDWKIGFLHFLLFLPVGILLGWAIGIVTPDVRGIAIWKVLGTFIGILWVVALSEEFFFRGLMQDWLAKWTGRPAIALAAASVLFGLAHIGFRFFPNWKFALLAAVAGLFYGRAYSQAGSIRASMVAHALTVTTWRALQ